MTGRGATCTGCGASLRDSTRYPIAALAKFMRLSEHQATSALGMSGSTQQAARCHGVTRLVADRLARKLDEHAFTIWPEMIEDDIAQVSVRCPECDDLFVPKTKRSVYCSSTCAQRHRRRLKYQNDPAYRERRKAASRRYRAECAPSVAARRAASRRTATRRRCLECPALFVPVSKRHKFCSKACGARRRARLRYRNDPAYRARRTAPRRGRTAAPTRLSAAA